MAKTPAWQRKEGKDPKGGLNAKGRASYNKATGGNLKPPAPNPKPKKIRDGVIRFAPGCPGCRDL